MAEGCPSIYRGYSVRLVFIVQFAERCKLSGWIALWGTSFSRASNVRFLVGENVKPSWEIGTSSKESIANLTSLVARRAGGTRQTLAGFGDAWLLIGRLVARSMLGHLL